MKLTDTQRVVLGAACNRADRLILPLPKGLKGGAVNQVVAGLLAKRLAREVPAHAIAPQQPPRPEIIWRTSDDGERLTLVATNAAFIALGLAPEADPAREGQTAPTIDDGAVLAGATPAAQGILAANTPAPGRETVRLPRHRENSKQAGVIAMLQRPEGATIGEIGAAFGWQPHTVRGVLAGALKKKLGLDIVSDKDETRGRIYRLSA